MDAKAKRPNVTWMALALIAATTMTSSGCAKLYHVLRYNCVSRLVGESHRTYYHGSNTGKIIPKEKRQCNVYEPDCYGYEATCWHRWPDGCGVCQNQEEVIYDGPYTPTPLAEPGYPTEAAADEMTAEPVESSIQTPGEQGAIQPAPGAEEDLNSFTPASPSDVDGANNSADPRRVPDTELQEQAAAEEIPVEPELPSEPEIANEVAPLAPAEPVDSIEPAETGPNYVEEAPEAIDPIDPEIPLRESHLDNRRQMVTSPAVEASELGLIDDELGTQPAPTLGAGMSRRSATREVPTTSPIESDLTRATPQDVSPRAPVTVPQRNVAAEDVEVVEMLTIDRENQRRFAERYALDLPAPRRKLGPLPAPLTDDVQQGTRVPTFKLPVAKVENAAVDQLEIEQGPRSMSELRFSDAPSRPTRLSNGVTELKFR